MKDENVINLVDYIEQKKLVDTSDTTQTIGSDISDNKMLIKRCYSFTIDFACIFTVHAALITSFAVFVSDFFQLSSMHLKMELLSVSLPYQLGIFLASYVGYFMFTQTVMDGQTLGQKVYGLNVCDENGKIVSNFKVSSSRSLAYLSYYLGLGVFQIVYFFNDEKKSFADMISGTYLVHGNQETKNAQIVTIEIQSLDKAA